jgi:hypothetical protein
MMRCALLRCQSKPISDNPQDVVDIVECGGRDKVSWLAAMLEILIVWDLWMDNRGSMLVAFESFFFFLHSGWDLG